MNIYPTNLKELRELYETNRYKFSNTFNHDKHFKKVVHSIMADLFDKYGHEKFAIIFLHEDELEQQKLNSLRETSSETMNQIIEDYIKERRGFFGKYNSPKLKSYGIWVNKNISEQILDERIDGNLDTNYIINLFYDYRHPHEKSKICKMCSNSATFHNFFGGYSDYCSVDCSRKDGSKTSEEMKAIGTAKRNVKMKALLNDPIRGAEYRQKISTSSKNYHNDPEFGEARRKAKSDIVKAKIAKGEFTPCITNTWTHWTIEIEGKKFRSSFDGIFHLYHNIYHSNNHQYEKLRVPYTFNGETKSYIVDFINYEDRIVYEIKPEGLSQEPKVLAKEQALLEWCKLNDYSYRMISEPDLMNYYSEMKTNFTHPFLDEFEGKYPKW